MLRVIQSSSVASATSYYTSADYYREGRETAGNWQGKAAAQLGLEGPVQSADWERLCQNQHPHTGKQLTIANV